MAMAWPYVRYALGVIIGIGSGTAACLSPTQAAVRQCQSAINVVGEDPTSEIGARRKAMAAWISKAGLHGQTFTRWQLAENRRVFCTKSAAGMHSCAVTGQPCTIRQVPGTTPPKPGTRGNPLET